MNPRIAATGTLLAAALILPTALTTASAKPADPASEVLPARAAAPSDMAAAKDAIEQKLAAGADLDAQANAARGATTDATTEARGAAQARRNKNPLATAEPLAAPEMNGVGWSTAVSSDLAIVGGEFDTVWKAGTRTAAKGFTNFVAFDPRTGELEQRFNHSFNGAVKVVEFSPDGKTLYVGGMFTKVGNVKRYRFAAFDVATGKLTDFKPTFDYRIEGITATDSVVYVGGKFSSVNGVARQNAAGINVKTGEVTSFNPQPNAAVSELRVEPLGRYIILGGHFTKMRDYTVPGWGAASTTSDTIYYWGASDTVKTGSKHASIYDMDSDADGVYVAGYDYDPNIDFEGQAAASWRGTLQWVKGCWGDSYGIATMDKIAYTVHHHHNCSPVGYLDEQKVRTYQRADAVSTYAQRGKVNIKGPYRGVAAPKVHHWFPRFDAGVVTGQNQGPWTVDANDGYVLTAGEFREVNDTKRKGIALFGTPAVTSKSAAPTANGAFTPDVRECGSGKYCIDFEGVWDYDSAEVGYWLVRDNKAVAYKNTWNNYFWNAPGGTFTDTPGAGEHSYMIVAMDRQRNYLYSKVVDVAGGDTAMESPADAGHEDATVDNGRVVDNDTRENDVVEGDVIEDNVLAKDAAADNAIVDKAAVQNAPEKAAVDNDVIVDKDAIDKDAADVAVDAEADEVAAE